MQIFLDHLLQLNVPYRLHKFAQVFALLIVENCTINLDVTASDLREIKWSGRVGLGYVKMKGINETRTTYFITIFQF